MRGILFKGPGATALSNQRSTRAKDDKNLAACEQKERESHLNFAKDDAIKCLLVTLRPTVKCGL